MTRFYRDVLERFHRLGALRFSELRLDGSLIAMSLDVLHGRRLYLLKTSYDERYAYFSPGQVLYLEMIRRSCNVKLRRALDRLRERRPG